MYFGIKLYKECTLKPYYISNLFFRYKKIVDSNNKTGRGHQTWAYFNAMQELLHNDPSVTAPVTVSSLHGKKGIVVFVDHLGKKTAC